MLLIHSYLLLVFCIQLNIYIEFKIDYTKMTIMSKKSASQCKQISYICTDPKRAYVMMLSYLKEEELYLKKLTIRNMFIKMIENKVGTDEVVNLARRIVRGHSSKQQNEVVRIMKMRLREVQDDLRSYKHSCIMKAKELRKCIKNNIVRKEFNAIKKEFKNYAWKICTDHCKKKLNHVNKKSLKDKCKKQRANYETFCKVTDADLSTIDSIDTSSNFEIYGEISLTEEERQCLSLGPKYMITPKLNKEDFEVEVEMECVKTRMELIKRNEAIGQIDPESSDSQVAEDEDSEAMSEIENMYRKDKEIYDETSGTLDMSKLLVTDAKYNIRSFPPREVVPNQEIKIQSRKLEVLTDFNQIRDNLCNNNGKQKRTNMTKEQKIGMKRLQDRVNNNEIVVTMTDKSGKFAIVEKALYTKAAEIHLKDEEVESELVTETETLLNRHTSQLLKSLNMGTKHGQNGQVHRMKQAFTSIGGKPGPLSFLIKDHKGMKEGEIIPPTRPVCNAKGGPGSRLSNLVSNILNRAADAINADTECDSTEDALRGILDCNRVISDKVKNDGLFAHEMKEVKVMSLDVKALYPSLRINEVMPILEDLIITVQSEQKFTIENIDWKELGKYLAITMTRNEQEINGITSALPRRTVGDKTRGRKPGPAYWDSDLIDRGDGIKIDKWKEPGEPTDEQKHKMVAHMVSQAVKVSMSNHMYRFGGKTYKQTDGGPIGDELSQAVARMVMIWWDKQFMKLCKELKIKVLFFKRYVDDTNLVVIPVHPGTRYVDNTLVEVPEMKDIDIQMGSDKATGRLMKSIADSITPMLIFEEDVCSNHLDNRIPILDLKVWPQVTENHVQIKHTFYMKPMANKATLKAGTAYPKSKLKAIMVNEVLRRLRNCSPDSSWKEKGIHITNFMNSMKCSGHSEKFRSIVVDMAVKRYKKELENHNKGIADLYRSKSERKSQVMSKGGKSSKDTWFRRKKEGEDDKQTTSVLKVPFTKGVLCQKISETVKSLTAPRGTRTRVQEDGGTKLRDKLIKQDPFPKMKCFRPDCTTTKNQSAGVGCGETCFQANVNYLITCDTCEEARMKGECDTKYIYIGETARGTYQRFKGHLDQYRSRKGFMWKHAEELHHNNTNLKFSVKREAVDKDPMRRVLRESVRINNSEENEKIKLMNTRDEYFGVKTVRAFFFTTIRSYFSTN